MTAVMRLFPKRHPSAATIRQKRVEIVTKRLREANAWYARRNRALASLAPLSPSWRPSAGALTDDLGSRTNATVGGAGGRAWRKMIANKPHSDRIPEPLPGCRLVLPPTKPLRIVRSAEHPRKGAA